jgi:hypothetical protein
MVSGISRGSTSTGIGEPGCFCSSMNCRGSMDRCGGMSCCGSMGCCGGGMSCCGVMDCCGGMSCCGGMGCCGGVGRCGRTGRMLSRCYEPPKVPWAGCFASQEPLYFQTEEAIYLFTVAL